MHLCIVVLNEGNGTANVASKTGIIGFQNRACGVTQALRRWFLLWTMIETTRTGRVPRTGSDASDVNKYQVLLGGSQMPEQDTVCFFCEGQTDYHPTCDRPDCDKKTHGHGPDGTTTRSYCPTHRSESDV